MVLTVPPKSPSVITAALQVLPTDPVFIVQNQKAVPQAYVGFVATSSGLSHNVLAEPVSSFDASM
jgi:hypothetical protein